MEWIEAYGFPSYEVSREGEIRNSKTSNILKPRLDNRDYLTVRIYKDGGKHSRRIAKLIWESFNDCKCKNTIDHIDRNKLNNSIDNLRCITASENSKNRDNYKGNNKYNLTPELKREILKKFLNKESSITALYKQYGVPFNYLSTVFKRGSWLKYLDDQKGISEI
jgi:hypothetical protein